MSKKNNKLPKPTIKHAIFALITIGVASSLSLIGGIGIEMVNEELITIVPLLIALPALNSAVGDYATIIAAHAGDPSTRARSRRELIKAVGITLSMSITFILVMSILLSLYRGYEFTGNTLVTFLLFVPVSMISVVILMFFITFFLDALLVRAKWNPDDVLIAVVTTISDIFMLGMIALAVQYLF